MTILQIDFEASSSGYRGGGQTQTSHGWLYCPPWLIGSTSSLL